HRAGVLDPLWTQKPIHARAGSRKELPPNHCALELACTAKPGRIGACAIRIVVERANGARPPAGRLQRKPIRPHLGASMAKRARTPLGPCTYCGEVRELTRDHVPPKGLFSRPRPSN